MSAVSGHTVAVVQRAPAKLTLSLAVTGVRPDGYHLLEAEMVSVDLADELEFGPGTGLEVVDATAQGLAVGALGSDGDNLVMRALASVRRRASVRLTKRIPVGAGLGGGSSDAAAVLRWAGQFDLELAARLGADVPFCVHGGRALVTGIGERVEPLAYEDRRFLLVLPPLSVDTPAVYRAWDDGRRTVSSGNDLQAAALAVEPRLAVWRDALADATGCRPKLAGSGSSWFVELGVHGVDDSDRVHRPDQVVCDGQVAPVVEIRTTPPV